MVVAMTCGILSAMIGSMQYIELSQLIKAEDVRIWLSASLTFGKKPLRSSFVAYRLIYLPVQLLSLAALCYLAGLGVYLGQVWVNSIPSISLSKGDDRKVFIVFVVSLIPMLFWGLWRVLKLREEETIRSPLMDELEQHGFSLFEFIQVQNRLLEFPETPADPMLERMNWTKSRVDAALQGVIDLARIKRKPGIFRLSMAFPDPDHVILQSIIYFMRMARDGKPETSADIRSSIGDIIPSRVVPRQDIRKAVGKEPGTLVQSAQRPESPTTVDTDTSVGGDRPSSERQHTTPPVLTSTAEAKAEVVVNVSPTEPDAQHPQAELVSALRRAAVAHRKCADADLEVAKHYELLAGQMTAH